MNDKHIDIVIQGLMLALLKEGLPEATNLHADLLLPVIGQATQSNQMVSAQYGNGPLVWSNWAFDICETNLTATDVATRATGAILDIKEQLGEVPVPTD